MFLMLFSVGWDLGSLHFHIYEHPQKQNTMPIWRFFGTALYVCSRREVSWVHTLETTSEDSIETWSHVRWKCWQLTDSPWKSYEIHGFVYLVIFLRLGIHGIHHRLFTTIKGVNIVLGVHF